MNLKSFVFCLLHSADVNAFVRIVAFGLFMYVVLAFTLWSANPGQWGVAVRVCGAAIWLFFSLVICLETRRGILDNEA